MATITIEQQEYLKTELRARYEALMDELTGRKLKSGREGCRPGHAWVEPKERRFVDKIRLTVAVNDLRAVLNQVIGKEVK